MGYNTHFSLRVDLMIGGTIAKLQDEAPLDAVIANLRQSCEKALYALDEAGGCSGNESKWYEHQKDMKAFSALNHSILFTLHGEGEESADLWNEYYLNGKLQVEKAQIQIAEFDAKKLK